jgi:membrane protein required for colicin V production
MNEIEQQVAAATGGFNEFDWVTLAIVLLSVAIGLYRGFGREALALMGWVAAFVLANVLADPLANALRAISDSETVRYLAGWSLVFVGVLAIFKVLASLFAQQMRQPGFNLGNRLLGGVFGLVRGMVVMLAITLVLRAILPDANEDLLDAAEIMPVLDTLAEWLGDNIETAIESAPAEQLEQELESVEML